jgi:hypothetical protein
MVEERRHRTEPDTSETEKKINKELIRMAEDNDEFLEYCEKRLLPSLAGSARRRSSMKGIL